MSSNTITPSESRGWRSGLNAVLLIAGLTAVVVAVGFQSPTAPTTVPPGAVVLPSPAPAPTLEEILTSLPNPPSTSLFGKALGVAMQQVRHVPQSAPAWISLGDVLAQGQRDTGDTAYFGHAEKAYQQALRLDPKAVDAMSGMAWVYGGRHQFDLSILWAEQALSRDPGHLASHGIIGDAAMERGNYELAFTHYQKMMDLRPDLSSLSRGAHLLWLTGNQTRAVLLMQQAISSGGPYAENTAWCRARLAMMFFHDGGLEPAAQALRPALENGSRHPHILLAAGRIAAARADYEAAITHYQTVLEAAPSLEALAALGDISAVQGDTQTAESYYARVEALHRTHRETGTHDHMEMARFYADHDRQLPEALRLALEHGHTGNPFEADTLAWVYFKNGDQTKAIEWMKTALQANLPDASVSYHAGCIAAAAGDRVSAVKHLQQALSRNPHFSLLLAKDAYRLLHDLGSTAPSVPIAAPVEQPRENRLLQLR